MVKASLNDLGLKFDTDKASPWHNFCNPYEEFLKGRSISKVLEVGIHKGGSLRMWNAYFGTAKVYGVDILDWCCNIHEDNIVAVKSDFSQKENIIMFFEEYGWDFDLIVDDGSHKWGHQLLAFKTIFPKLKSGSIYILEDLHSSRHLDYKDVDITPLFIFENLALWNLVSEFRLIDNPGNSGLGSTSILMVRK